MSDQIEKLNALATEIENFCPKCFGPGKKWEIEIDWDSFDKAEDKDRAMHFISNWNGYYSLQPVKNAIYRLSSWEDDEIVDACAEGIKKLKIKLEPGTDTQKKRYEFDDGKLSLYCVFEAQSWSGVFDESELRSLFVEVALASRPDLKISLLKSVATNYWTRWGWISSLKKIVDDAGLYPQPEEELVKAVNENGFEGSYIKLYDNVLKVNKRGSKQKRYLLITTSKFYTFEAKGNVIKKDSWQPHNYGDIICIDLYPSGTVVKEWQMIAYTNEEKPKKPSFFDKFKGKLPGVKLPGIPMPSMPSISAPSLPSVDLPSVDLPSMDMPSMPSIDLPDVDISNPFKRHKEEPPKRMHPADKGKRFFNFIIENGDVNDKNINIQELGWVFYAGYANGTRNVDYLPFYLDKKEEFAEAREITEAKAPKVKAQEVKSE